MLVSWPGVIISRRKITATSVIICRYVGYRDGCYGRTARLRSATVRLRSAGDISRRVVRRMPSLRRQQRVRKLDFAHRTAVPRKLFSSSLLAALLTSSIAVVLVLLRDATGFSHLTFAWICLRPVPRLLSILQKFYFVCLSRLQQRNGLSDHSHYSTFRKRIL